MIFYILLLQQPVIWHVEMLWPDMTFFNFTVVQLYTHIIRDITGSPLSLASQCV